MKTPIALTIFLTGMHPAFSQTDEYTADLSQLSNDLQSNQLTQFGYWVEQKNVMGEWEKMIFIFGFADPGDEAACLRLVELAVSDSPAVEWRCKPID
ncbi:MULTISPECIES: hypothetical protein [unclassified Roseovarius]|uniref:hypothetical protein n=1 Tax=unclassified Roseovarius TaxID=2614913 RepID=UPI00273F675D|nr:MULTISPECIES: hypothetical protein [unclassified Roseovarius]